MKSKVTYTESKELEYPCLKTSGDLIVLFSQEGCGTAINRTAIYHVGDYRIDWHEDSFKPFTGTVTLSN